MIRKARRDAGLEQEDLAKLIGVSRPTLSNWERDVHVPPVDKYQAIALATNADWLLSGLVDPAGVVQRFLSLVDVDDPPLPGLLEQLPPVKSEADLCLAG